MKNIYQHINPAYYPPQELETFLKAQAIWDIIMNSEEDSWLRLVQRYTSDTPAYCVSDGSGHEMDIFFEENGVFIKGFDHQNELNQYAKEDWDDEFFKETYEGIPSNFLDIYEDEDSLMEMTFCMWYDNQTGKWNQTIVEGDDGGKDFILSYICSNADQWIEWAEDYYEMDIDKSIVEKVYQKKPLTAEDIHKLDPERNAQEALDEIAKLMGNKEL